MTYAHAPFLITATRLGGSLGYDDAGATAPLGGAVSGFTKAYHREQANALAKVVDFPIDYPADALADQLVRETERDAGVVEVGHAADGTRWTIGLCEAPLGEATHTFGKDAVFVVTGGAGSIVSAITADLADASGGVFHLLDLSPRPETDDADVRRFSTDRDGLKSELAARMKAAGTKPTPVLIDKELARYERLAAARAAIDAVNHAGGTAYYHQVDLTDAAAVSAVVEEIRRTSERVDVLLHAAGLEISKSLPDKEPREFDLVFDVKTSAWFNLMRALGDVPVGATVAFCSVAGRFGNAGQADYSAANDLLCKITSSYRRTRPHTHAIALDWTAWAGMGMATRGSIPTIMERAGIEMLDPAVGVPWVRHELLADYRGEAVVAGALGILGADTSTKLAEIPVTGPMIGTAALGREELVVTTMLDPMKQPFLNDHRIDGTAVLPGVMGMEAFTEAARLLAPERKVAALEDVDFLAPLKFYRDEPRTITVRARGRRDGADLVVDCRLQAARTLAGSAEPEVTTHFTGSVRLTAEAVRPVHEVAVSEPKQTVSSQKVYELYFHGPAYQVVTNSWQDGEGSAAKLRFPLPPNHAGDAPTYANPRLIELCFQTAGLWEAARYGRLALPQHVDRVCLVKPGAAPKKARNGRTAKDGAFYAVAHESGDHFDASVRDASGDVVLTLEGYRTVALPTPVPEEVRRGLTTTQLSSS